MPRIVAEKAFDGAEALIERLRLDELLAEVRSVVTGFELLVEERTDRNGSAAMRALIDSQFKNAKGWVQIKAGGVDWTKCQHVNARRKICIGVEIQVSGRSDLLSVDLIHLRAQLLQGKIDLAVLIVPSDKLGAYLN